MKYENVNIKCYLKEPCECLFKIVEQERKANPNLRITKMK